MADAAPTTPATPAATSTNGQATGQTAPEAPASTKERGADGKFLKTAPQDTAAPKETPAPEAPKRWKVGEEEFDSPDALAERAALLAEKAKAADSFRAMVEKSYLTHQEAQNLTKRLSKEAPEAERLAALRELGLDPVQLGRQSFLAELEQRKKYAEMFGGQPVPEPLMAELEKAKEAQRELERLREERAERERRDAQAKADADRQRERESLVGTISEVWAKGMTRLPQTPYVLGLAAEEYRIQKLAGMEPSPRLIAQRLEEAWGESFSAYDTDESFDARAYIKKYPKRAEAIRLAALEEAGLSPQAQGAAAPKVEPKPKVDPADRWAEVWGQRRH